MKIKNGYVKAFLLSFLAAAFAFGWSIVTSGGLFSLAGDFNSQQIVFATHYNDMIKAGQLGFDYALDLGSSVIGGMAFYILGNPSFWLALLLPSKVFMYIVGWLYVLKYALAGMTAYAFMRRHVKDSDSAVIASLLYSFSGFSAEALLFYHFHDVVWLFPLLMLAFDRLMTERKRGGFAVAVLFNAIVCYYFFVGEFIFLVLYFFIVYAGQWQMRERIGHFLDALIEGILGAGLGLGLLLPAALFTLQNPRVDFDYTGSNSLLYGAERYLFILKGLLFPGEVMSEQSAVISKNFSTCSAYLPMVGLVLVIAFIILNRKHRLTRFLTTILICAVVPIFNAAYSMFAGLYCRWYYMAILMMALASAYVIAQWKKETAVFSYPTPTQRAITKACLIWGIIAAAFILFLTFVSWSKNEPSKIYETEVFIAWSIVCLAGILMTWFVFTSKSRYRVKYVALAIYLFSLGTTAAAVAMYQYASAYRDSRELYEVIRDTAELDMGDPAYRYANQANVELLSHGIKNNGVFCSTVSGSIFRLYEGLALERSVKSPESPEGFAQLTSARYTFETEEREDEIPIKTVLAANRTYYVYENASVAPIGFVYHSYITATDLKSAMDKDKAILMLKHLVVADDEIDKVRDSLTHGKNKLTAEESDEATRSQMIDLNSAAHLEECSSDYYEDSYGFGSTIVSKGEGYAFYSIPNDEGWSAKVNGEEAEILDVNGFMAVRVRDGENTITFAYETPGLKVGGLGSAVSAVLLAAYLFIFKTKAQKKTDAP